MQGVLAQPRQQVRGALGRAPMRIEHSPSLLNKALTFRPVAQEFLQSFR